LDTSVKERIGGLVAFAGSKAMSSLLYEQSARDPLVLGAVVIVPSGWTR
jgi:hypothetical protein